MTGLLQHYVETHSRTQPDSPALVMEQQVWSYSKLDRFANRLARSLRSAGCEQGDRVAFMLPKSPLAIGAMLAILKADCIYVPIDPAGSPGRTLKILRSSDPKLLLVDNGSMGLLSGLAAATYPKPPKVAWVSDSRAPAEVVDVAFRLEDVSSQSEEPLRYSNTSSDGAYILYTSGSTGVPKGVLITHANVMTFVEWATSYFKMGPSDRVSGHAPLHFDLSALDIFGTFAAGAQLCPVPELLNLSPHHLAEFIRSERLTQWFSVPSALNYMAKFDVVRPGDFPELQRVLWCGEVLPTAALRYWMNRLPHVTFTNLYGPTETTIASSYHTVMRMPEQDDESIPIGKPCAGEDLLVLDEGLNPVRPGEIGELYISGAGLSPGYWRDPEKTKAAFLEKDERVYRTGDLARVGPDGLVYFVGRVDSQIKSRGYRIELGEIESELNTLTILSESAVVAVKSETFDNFAICCAFVPRPGMAVTPAVVRKSLSEKLPAYMLPSRWLKLDKLPRNGNEKVNRPRIQELFKSTESTGPEYRNELTSNDNTNGGTDRQLALEEGELSMARLRLHESSAVGCIDPADEPER